MPTYVAVFLEARLQRKNSGGTSHVPDSVTIELSHEVVSNRQ